MSSGNRRFLPQVLSLFFSLAIQFQLYINAKFDTLSAIKCSVYGTIYSISINIIVLCNII